MLSSIESDSSDIFFFWLCLGLFILLLQGVVGGLMRRYCYSNLVKAKAILKVPVNITVRGGWKDACYRDQEGASLRSAKVKHVEGGILFRDMGSCQQILFPPRHGVVFIPGERLVNHRSTSLGWYTKLFLGKAWVELDVEGCSFSVVIQMQEGYVDYR